MNGISVSGLHMVIENLNTGNKINMSSAALLKFIKLVHYGDHNYAIKGNDIWLMLHLKGYIL